MVVLFSDVWDEAAVVVDVSVMGSTAKKSLCIFLSIVQWLTDKCGGPEDVHYAAGMWAVL